MALTSSRESTSGSPATGETGCASLRAMRLSEATPLLAVFASAVLATPPANAAEPKPTLALVGGQVIDGYEGPPIRDGVVLVAKASPRWRCGST